MLSLYANQTVTHKTKASVNAYNEATYTSASIKARLQYERQVIRTASGEDVTSNAQIYTTTAIKEDDVLTFDGKDWTIRQVLNMYDLNGNIAFYKGVL